jgi:HEAT repeat protein
MEMLESWIKGLQSPDPAERIKAGNALETWAFAASNSERASLARLKQDLPILLATLKDPKRLVRLRAVRILSALGPLETDAIAAVVEVFHRHAKDEVLRDDALSTLGWLGPGALPFLWDLWRAKMTRPRYRKRVLSAASYIGPEALPLILEGFKKKNPDYWVTVKEALGMLESRFPCDLVSVLRAALDRPEPLLRINAAGLLIARAPEFSRQAVDCIRRFLCHRKPVLREAAIDALHDAASGMSTFHGKCASDALAAIREGVPRAPEGVQDALPELLTLLKDQNPRARQQAIQIVSQLGPRGKEAVPLLVDIILHDPTECFEVPFSTMAAEALGGIGPTARAAVPALTQMLDDDQTTMPTGIPKSLFAAVALGKIGPAARPALPALRRLLQRTIPQLQHNVVEALAQIEGPGERQPWWRNLLARWRR